MARHIFFRIKKMDRTTIKFYDCPENFKVMAVSKIWGIKNYAKMA